MKLKTVALIVGGLLVLSIGISLITKLTNNDSEVDNPQYTTKEDVDFITGVDFEMDPDVTGVPVTPLSE